MKNSSQSFQFLPQRKSYIFRKDEFLQCQECKSVHKEKKPKNLLVRVIVSKGKESVHTRAVLSGTIRKEDEILIDDEATGEAYLVKITSIEVGDKRQDER